MLQVARSCRPLLLAGIVALVLAAPAAAQSGVQPGATIATLPATEEALPSFTGTTLSGASFSSAELKGRTVVLLLWTVDCPHARSIASALPALARRIEQAGGVLYLADFTRDGGDSRSVLGAFDPARVLQLAHAGDAFMNHEVYAALGVPVTRAIMVPAVVVADDAGIVRHSAPWNGADDAVRAVRALTDVTRSRAR